MICRPAFRFDLNYYLGGVCRVTGTLDEDRKRYPNSFHCLAAQKRPPKYPIRPQAAACGGLIPGAIAVLA